MFAVFHMDIIVNWKVEERIRCFTSRGALQSTKGLYCVPVKFVPFYGGDFLVSLYVCKPAYFNILKTFFVVFFAVTVGSESLRPKYLERRISPKSLILSRKPGIKRQV